jgi:hypothetical protein
MKQTDSIEKKNWKFNAKFDNSFVWQVATLSLLIRHLWRLVTGLSTLGHITKTAVRAVRKRLLTATSWVQSVCGCDGHSSNGTGILDYWGRHSWVLEQIGLITRHMSSTHFSLPIISAMSRSVTEVKVGERIDQPVRNFLPSVRYPL